MKKLLLLRHAKSDWSDERLSDFERPLNERGKRAAGLMGTYMRERSLRPDLLLSSPSRRTRETVALVTEAAEIETEVRYDERIYEASLANLLEIISELDNDKEEVLLVGHNPGMEYLIGRLAGEAHRVPTATLSLIALDAERWNEAVQKGGQLEWIVRPKELESE